MLYRGSCHCGRVAYEVEGTITAALACNCSICSRKGILLWAVPYDRLRLLSAGDEAGVYTFNRHVFLHRFCRTCGIHPYAEDVSTARDRMAYVNLRCLEDIDIDSIPVQHYDGRSV